MGYSSSGRISDSHSEDRSPILLYPTSDVKEPMSKKLANRQKQIDIAKKCKKCVLKERVTVDENGKQWVMVTLTPCKAHETKIFQAGS